MAFLHTLLALAVAFVLGTAIGFERQWRQRSAEEEIELEADLIPTTADPAELDQVTAELERSPLIRSATWSVGTTS